MYLELYDKARSYSAMESAARPSSLMRVPRSVRAMARLTYRGKVSGKEGGEVW